MFIEQMYAPIALDHTEMKKLEARVSCTPKSLNEYMDTLRRIAKTSNYEEGQPLSEDDLTAIKESMGKVFDSAVRGFADQDEQFKAEIDGKDYVMATYDYLFALAMNELNSPDIPKDPMEELLGDFSEKLGREVPVKAPWISERYNAQRYQNADYLKKYTLNSLLSPDDKGNYPSAQMASLYAEYRALRQRQDDHTGFWRFFHRTENAARNNLLKEMEDVMKKTIPEDVFNKLEDPADVLKYYAGNSIKTSVSFSMARREALPYLDFGYSKYHDNPEMCEEYMKNREKNDPTSQKSDTENLNEKLGKDTSESVINNSDRKIEPKTHSAPSKNVTTY